MALDKASISKTVKKARQLCEYMPNLIIYDAALTVQTNTMHLAVAIILEARRKC